MRNKIRQPANGRFERFDSNISMSTMSRNYPLELISNSSDLRKDTTEKDVGKGKN